MRPEFPYQKIPEISFGMGTVLKITFFCTMCVTAVKVDALVVAALVVATKETGSASTLYRLQESL